MSNNDNKYQNRTEVKERIARASMALFFEKGIKQVKMDDIATHLSISKRTMYELFFNKEELLKEGLLLYHKERKQKIEQFTNIENVLETILLFFMDTIKHLRNINPIFFDDILKYPDIIRLLSEDKERNSAATVQWLKEGVKQGIFRSDINYETMLIFLNRQKDMLQKSDIKHNFSVDDIYTSVIMVLLRGISTTKGLEYIERFFQENQYKQ